MQILGAIQPKPLRIVQNDEVLLASVASLLIVGGSFAKPQTSSIQHDSMASIASSKPHHCLAIVFIAGVLNPN